jgi:MGT family glycosyltransferase
MESLQGLYKEVLVPLNLHLYREIKPLFEKETFDFVITDHQAFAGAVLAFQHNIAYATSVTSPAAIEPSRYFPEIINFERNQIVEFQQSVGVNLGKPLVCNSPLTLVYSTKLFLQNHDFPKNYEFIGPSLSGRPTYDIAEIDGLGDSVPKVLVTLGSILKSEKSFLDTMIEAFGNEKINIILVSDPGLKKRWPDNFHVFRHIPQIKVLGKVDAVVCHAGYNTVCEALSFGLPLVTLPIVNDQSYVATKVKNSGAGIRLKYKRLKSGQLKQSLREVLTHPSYREAAQKIKASFNKAGGSKRAAELVENRIHGRAGDGHRLEALSQKDFFG